MKSLLSWLGAFGLLTAANLNAQGYSVQGTFDTSKASTLNGVIRNIQTRGGLTYLSVDVRGENGSVVPWMLRLSAPTLLDARGFPRTSFQTGSQIAAEVWPERNPPTRALPRNSARNMVPPGTNFGAAWKLTFADGRVLDEASRPAAPWPTEPDIFPSQR